MVDDAGSQDFQNAADLNLQEFEGVPGDPISVPGLIPDADETAANMPGAGDVCQPHNKPWTGGLTAMLAGSAMLRGGHA